MNVLYLDNSGQIGGGNCSLLTLWDALRKMTIRPVAVCPNEGPMVQACRDRGITCLVRPYDRLGWRQPRVSWTDTREWARLLADNAIAIVHANGPQGGRAVSLAAWQAGLPLVCHCRFPEDPAMVAWNYRWLKPPDAVIFVSHDLHKQMSPIYKRFCPRTRQLVVHNAVDLAAFQSVPKTARTPLRVGIVANLVRVKGHEDFLRMARELRNRGHSDAEFWIVGGEREPGYEAELKELAANLGLEQKIRFLGFRSDISLLLPKLDVLVCASHVEPFGRCLIEAMACELPVVATLVGGIPEVVEDGVTGLLVPSQQPFALANAVGQLLDDEFLRRRFGSAGRARVERLFTREVHALRIAAIYTELITKRRRRRAVPWEGIESSPKTTMQHI